MTSNFLVQISSSSTYSGALYEALYVYRGDVSGLTKRLRYFTLHECVSLDIEMPARATHQIETQT